VNLIVNKLATPQENLFLTDLELRTHGFIDHDHKSQEDITRVIMQQGEVSRFNGNMTGNSGITYEKC
jgi:hypothetical protein